MVREMVKVKNPTGFQVKPAGRLCKAALKYKSKITYECRGKIANAKSVLSVLGSSVKYGEEIMFICEGEDEQQALEEMVNAVRNGLGEFSST
jgi:phosphocarrier protein